MDTFCRLLRRVRYLLRRDVLDREMDEEIRFHIERETERNMAAGMSLKEARRRALIDFGGVERHRAATRQARGVAFIDGIAWDFRNALRSVRRAPHFTLVVALTLGVGIGANTAIFSVVEAVLLRRIPLPEPDRLVTVSSIWDGQHYGTGDLASFKFREWRESQGSFEALAAVGVGGAIISDGGDPMQMEGARVSADYFRAIGVEPFIGRSFSPEEYERDGPNVVVVSHDFWVTRLGSDPDALGRTISMQEMTYTVIGVMPEGIRLYRTRNSVTPISFWRPDPWDTWAEFDIVARLRDGVSVAQADAELRAWGNSIWTYEFDASDPDDRIELVVEPLHDVMTAQRRAPLFFLLGAVGFILLIACLNVGNLLLARGESRASVVTLRRALGASRVRVAREFLAESLVISTLGTLLGIVLARMLIPFLVAVGPVEVLRNVEVKVNATVLLFAAAVTITTALLTGIAPARRATRSDLIEELKEHGGGATGGRKGTLGRSALVVAQVSIATVLVIGSGLFLRSYGSVSAVPLGFDPEGVVVVRTALDNRNPSYYEPMADADGTPGYRVQPAVESFVYEVVDGLGAIRGVTSAALGNFPPLGGYMSWYGVAEAPAHPEPRSGFNLEWGAFYRPVTADWFETVGIPFVEGRSFHAEESARAEDVAVIDERLAQRLWPGESAVDRLLTVSDGAFDDWRSFRVVGVVANARQATVLNGEIPSAEPGVVYYPPSSWAAAYHQMEVLRRRLMHFVVRTNRSLADIGPELRKAVWAADPGLPVTVAPLSQLVRDPSSQLRFNMGILMAFAALALFLAASGVFAVMAYAVSRKVRELGIRVALGARAAQLRRTELLGGLRLGLFGVAVGAVGAAGLTRFIQSFLYGIGPLDARVYAAAGALLLCVTVAAAYLPARRAASVDPMQSLRTE
jgi:predicted permease